MDMKWAAGWLGGPAKERHMASLLPTSLQLLLYLLFPASSCRCLKQVGSGGTRL